jgi:pyruvate dehydrogenase E1 component alpha subunit/2-oxoisovalerate dehydrogenase E1 component alpha subunit
MAEEKPKNRKRGPRRPAPFQMRISTKYAPRKVVDGQTLSCTKDTSLKPEQMLELYRYLKLTRLVEERIVNLYRQTKVVGGVFRSLGQEATAVGSAYALRPDDFITPIIRDLGAVFVKGIRPRDIFAQYMAKAWGPSGGKDLNVHFGDLDKGFIGPISHLGDMIPVMTGILLAARMQQKNIVGLAYIGDGGASTGAFYEGMNFAAVQRLPLIVIVEYNHYAYSTPNDREFACDDLMERANGYGFEGYSLDGTDLAACLDVIGGAVKRARAGRPPQLVVASVLRLSGHGEHDDASYVSEEMKQQPFARDCLKFAEQTIIESKLMDPDTVAAWRKDAVAQVDEAVAAAQKEAVPEADKEDWCALSTRDLVDHVDEE